MKITTLLQNTLLLGSGALLGMGTSFAQTQEKPTTTQYRVKAITMSRYDTNAFVVQDSTRYFWGGTNHMSDNYFVELYLPYPNNDLNTPSMVIRPTLNADSTNQYFWNSDSNQYYFKRRQIIGLNSGGEVSSNITLVNSGTGWDNFIKISYMYDGQANLISEKRQSWSGTAWDNQTLREYAYDSQNRFTSMIMVNWTGSAWDSTSKAVYDYDAQNNYSSQINYIGVGGSWQESAKTTLFNSGGQRDSMLQQQWNTTANGWENYLKVFYSYNSNAERDTDIYFSWNSNAWTQDKKYIYTYNGSGKLTRNLSQTWAGSNWQDYIKTDYNYAGGNLSLLTIYNWNYMASQLEENIQYKYLYNSNDLCTESVAESWDGTQWMHQQYDNKVNFYYEDYDDGITGIQDILEKEDYLVYPNPASEQINVKMAGRGGINQVSIVDMNGRVVYQSKGSFNASQVNIPVQNLAEGVYLLQVQSGSKKGTKTIVVRH